MLDLEILKIGVLGKPLAYTSLSQRFDGLGIGDGGSLPASEVNK